MFPRPFALVVEVMTGTYTAVSSAKTVDILLFQEIYLPLHMHCSPLALPAIVRRGTYKKRRDESVRRKEGSRNKKGGCARRRRDESKKKRKKSEVKNSMSIFSKSSPPAYILLLPS